MTEKQYTRANRFVSPFSLLIICGIVLCDAMTVLSAAKGTSRFPLPLCIITLILDAVSIAAVIYAKRKFVTSRMGGFVILGAGMLAFLGLALTTDSFVIYTYAVALMITSLIYLDTKLTLITCIEGCVGSLIIIISDFPAGKMEVNDVMIMVFSLALTFIGCLGIIRRLTEFNRENLSIISEASARAEEMNRNVVSAAQELKSAFDSARSTIDQLEESIDRNQAMVTGIADSTESTAQTIEKQTVMCSEISERTGEVGDKMKTMTEASGKTTDTAARGVDIVNELGAHAEIVREASDETVASTEALSGKVNEVSDIVGVISEISSRTNLLALNASIEAARAGDAGRGFAVVADEIRQLSEQTKDSTDKIRAVIAELNDEAGKANAAVHKTISSVDRQNEMIANTKEVFSDISTDIDSLAAEIKEIRHLMDGITTNTNEMVDSISNLSATSEEIAASSAEGVDAATRAVGSVSEVVELINTVNILAEKLEEATK